VARGSFEDQLRAFQVKTERKLDEVPRRVVFEMFQRIVFKTPVDEGRARSNWQPSIGSPATGTIEAPDKSGNATIAKAKAILAIANAGDTIYLSNNLPYIRRLEEGGYPDGPKTVGGFSTQAPAGMVALTVQEFAAIVKQIGLEVSIQ
jgi:hypothetical protein